MSLRNHTLIKEHAYLTSQLKAEVQRQTQEISGLVNERQKLLSELLHDLKSPMASIYAYIQLIQNNKILLDKKTSEQLNTIADQFEKQRADIQAEADIRETAAKNEEEARFAQANAELAEKQAQALAEFNKQQVNEKYTIRFAKTKRWCI